MQNKKLIELGTLLPVMEEFYSIQGEGVNTGKPAYFVRIAGCDVCCGWCDVKESWDKDLHPLVKTDDIINNILNSGAKAVVVTGGEPMLYNLDYFCSKLKESNIETYLETSGNVPISGKWDWICLSPKKQSSPLKENLIIANELKVVVKDIQDIERAEELSAFINKNCFKCLQPEWGNRKIILPKIIDYILSNPKWRLSMQTHKFIGIP
jgi:organic radical activating enzyme